MLSFILAAFGLYGCFVYADSSPFPVRLVGGNSSNEGRVEIYHDYQWGSFVIAHGHSRRQKYSLAVPLHDSYYGGGNGTQWIADVNCTGHENTLAACGYSGWGHTRCSHSFDASVMCIPQSVSMTPVEIRFHGNSSSNHQNQGLVDLKLYNKWGRICADNFGGEEADVVCRMLGYSGGGLAIRHDEYAFPTKGLVWLYGLKCQGNETSIIDCSYNSTVALGCGHAAVSCWNGVKPTTQVKIVGGARRNQGKVLINFNNEWGTICASRVRYQEATVICPSDVRLVNGSRDSEGRLEVFYNGTWGTVCDNNFGKKSAAVVCRMLGYLGQHVKVRGSSYYGKGTGPEWLDEVTCSGNETSLFTCKSRPWGDTRCNLHYSDVGVDCQAQLVPKTLVRLVGGGHGEGILQVYHNNQWGTVSNNNFDEKEAKVVCTQLGLTGTFGMPMPTSRYGFVSGPVWIDSLSCTGEESEIDDCPHIRWVSKSYGHSYDAAVYCIPPSSYYIYIRLSGGSRPSEGRVELWYNGKWGTICGNRFDNRAASVVCRQLGYLGQFAITKPRSSYGTPALGTEVWLTNVTCDGTEDSIYSCNKSRWGSTGPYRCSGHYEDITVDCEPWTQIYMGIRLVNGSNNRMGRVEVSYNNTWGTVCDDRWDSWSVKDATVACNQLGFLRSIAVPVSGAYFGQGAGGILLHKLNCNGTEANIGFCKKDALGYNNCSHTTDAGLMCLPRYTGSPETINVRIVDGSSPNFGRVEVQFRGYWGTICDDNWDNIDAKVVCKQLGYSGGHKLLSGEAGPGQGPIWMNNVGCIGNETHIERCTFDGWGKHDCLHREDAAVFCENDGSIIG